MLVNILVTIIATASLFITDHYPLSMATVHCPVLPLIYLRECGGRRGRQNIVIQEFISYNIINRMANRQAAVSTVLVGLGVTLSD